MPHDLQGHGQVVCVVHRRAWGHRVPCCPVIHARSAEGLPIFKRPVSRDALDGFGIVCGTWFTTQEVGWTAGRRT